VIGRRSEKSREREGTHGWRLDLSGAILKRANLSNAHLEGAYLWGAHLEGAYLVDAYLLDAQLEGVDLRGTMGLAVAQGLAKASGDVGTKLPLEIPRPAHWPPEET
jgi:hypothetical protein